MKKNVVTLLVLALVLPLFANTIDRLDIYDSADNHLLFVTFTYNGAGVCTGRDIFTSDSTFMYHTTVPTGTANETKKEISVDYMENPMYTITVKPPSGGATEFSAEDQFGLSQFGAPLRFSEATTNTYDVKQESKLLAKETYTFDTDGNLTRISMRDESGNEAWYGLVTYKGVYVKSTQKLPLLNRVQIHSSRAALQLQFTLSKESVVYADLFSPSGRRVLQLVQKKFKSGAHTLALRDMEISNGTYIVRMSVDGVAPVTSKIVVQR